eukprot:CAMPEP_0172500016 /NCGR_PEP_ID=MMETSP1066-20121228/133528_1 /TAXON_ID=671091 /ORGANISM="Coscinodiscus wailesii, Strain CCMP2513" /LENGTH=119 /DNA_ID=CAMNT_0013274055 /DNA_START=184 /DNA_END=543 /DNA_ORIENTATION=-
MVSHDEEARFSFKDVRLLDEINTAVDASADAGAGTDTPVVVNTSSLSSRQGFGYLLLTLVILSLFYVLYLCYKRWRTIREFQKMEETRVQADIVLSEMSDMGMGSLHGSRDDEDDSEII